MSNTLEFKNKDVVELEVHYNGDDSLPSGAVFVTGKNTEITCYLLDLKRGMAALDKVNELQKENEELKKKLETSERFEKHIQSHLKEGEVVICKICGKSAADIKGE